MPDNSLPALSAQTILTFRRGYRLRKPTSGVPEEENRPVFTLGPERGWKCSPTAAAVIEQIDGKTTLGEISQKLAETYTAAPEIILADMIEVLTPLLHRGIFKILPHSEKEPPHG